MQYNMCSRSSAGKNNQNEMAFAKELFWGRGINYTAWINVTWTLQNVFRTEDNKAYLCVLPVRQFFLLLSLINLRQEWFQHCLHFLAWMSFNWVSYLLVNGAFIFPVNILQIETTIAPLNVRNGDVIKILLLNFQNYAKKCFEVTVEERNLKVEIIVELFDFSYISGILLSIILLKQKHIQKPWRHWKRDELMRPF